MRDDCTDNKVGTATPAAGFPDGLIYKADQDLARVKERFAAFWQGEIVDRVCLAVTAPSGANVPVPVVENDEQAHTDPEFQVRRCNAGFANTWYGGEAPPNASNGWKGSLRPWTAWAWMRLARPSPMPTRAKPPN